MDFDAVLRLCRVCHLFHTGTALPFEAFFLWGNPENKSLQERSGGAGGQAGFWSHTAALSARAGRGAVRPHVVRVGPRHEMGHRADSPRESSLTPSTAAQPHAGWCTGADGLPERSARGGACATPAPPPGEHSGLGVSPRVWEVEQTGTERRGSKHTLCTGRGLCSPWDVGQGQGGGGPGGDAFVPPGSVSPRAPPPCPVWPPPSVGRSPRGRLPERQPLASGITRAE